MELSQNISVRQVQTLSPQFILSQQLLQMPVMELMQELAKELDQNPILEIEEVILCSGCRRPLKNAVCEYCGKSSEYSSGETDLFIQQHVLEYAANDDQHYESGILPDEDAPSPIAQFVSRENSFHEQLVYNFLSMNYPPGTEELGEYLIRSIDDNGFMDYDLQKTLELYSFDEQTIEKTIKIIQSLDPVGVGARNPKEALLIQISALEEEGKHDEVAKILITDFFHEIGKSMFAKVAKLLDLPVSRIQEAMDFIKNNLNPFPGRAYMIREPVQEAKPAIIIRFNGRELTYYVVELADFKLKINKSYIEMFQNNRNTGEISRNEMSHVREYFRRAKFFQDNIETRKRTLDKIAKCLCEEQKEFLVHGLPYFNTELTQGSLAEKIGLHESTISRAMSGKFILIPSGEIISFDFFFDSSIRPKEYIKNIISNENPEDTVSDQQLCELLKEKGIDIARRTVAKYREELKIPSSFERRRMYT